MKHTISLTLLLAAMWLLNSGHYTPLIIGFGIASVILVLRIAQIMDRVDQAAQPIHLTLRLPAYWAWLMKEVVLSNIEVVKCIWLGKKSIHPVVGTLKISQQTDMGRVIYANSITLTPGTVTIDLQDDTITVHALTRKGFEALEKGEMDRRVTALE